MSERIDHTGFLSQLFVRFLRTIVQTPAGIKALGISRYLYRPNPNDWVDTNHITIPISGLPHEFEGYRLVQISDFHLGTWLTRDYLLDAIRQVNELEPDLVAITGDFVTIQPERYMDDLSAGVSHLSARDGIVAILGNHDHWTDPELICRSLGRIGVSVLANSTFPIQRGAATLYVAGLDDMMVEKDDLPKILSELPLENKAILLAHEPDYAEISSKTSRFALQLSGHAHGGQIILPSIGPLYLPHHARKYPTGLHDVDGMLLYTNSGLGTAELQFRYNSRPEIAVFTLKSVN